MAAQTQKKQSTKTQGTPKRRFDDAIARFAISEDGYLVYANDLFYALAGTQDVMDKTIIADSFIHIDHKKNNPQDITSLSSGTYPLRVNGQSESHEFYFEWLTTPSKKRYLIASEAEENHQNFTDDEMKAFARKIHTIVSAKEKIGSLPRIENQEDLRRFLNMSHDVMIVTTLEGYLVRMNTTFYKLLGFNDEELQGLKFIDLFEEEDRPHINSALETLSYDDDAGDAVIDFEARVKTKSGRNLIMEWRQMERSGQFYCVGRDITAIRENEAALLRRENQLLEAESIGRMGHWHWRVGDDLIEWSEEIYRIFGVEREDFQPSLHRLDQLVYRRDVGRVIQGFQRAIIEQKDYDMEFRIKRPDGEIRFIRCEGRTQKDQEGDVIALYGIMQDMTERILYEKELHEAKDGAERAYAAKSQFLANMSHELRTPLNAIIGFSEIMQKQILGPMSSEKYMEYVDGIRESGQHLLDLISDILDMSKIEAGKYELDLEEIDVVSTTKLAIHMMEGRARESNVKIHSELQEDENLKIIADRRAFLQILLNLLSNAVKFTQEGGAVTLKCEAGKKFISLNVIDNGIGIPANKLQQITRPFEQVSASYAKEHEGSGLGLAITKELVEMHKGSLIIESRVGVGTDVCVRLPFDAKSSSGKS